MGAALYIDKLAGAGIAARESFWRTQLPLTRFRGNAPPLFIFFGWMSFLLSKMFPVWIKYFPAFDQIFLARRAITQRPTETRGQEEDLGHQTPLTLPSLPLSELTIICVLVAAQRKSSIPVGGELSPSSASELLYKLANTFYSITHIGTALQARELCLLHPSHWSRATGW